MIISSVWKAACRSHLQFCSSASLFLPLCILRLDDPSLPLFLCLSLSLSISFVPASPPPALHQPTPAIFTPHTSVAALIQPQTAAGSIAKWIIQQQSTSPSPSLPLPLSPPLSLSMHSSSRGSSEAEGPYWAGPRLSTSQALYWGVYGALCCQRSALPSPSSIILGSRAAITAQTGGQSPPSRKLYRRWREKQRRERRGGGELFFICSHRSCGVKVMPGRCMDGVIGESWQRTEQNKQHLSDWLCANICAVIQNYCQHVLQELLIYYND